MSHYGEEIHPQLTGIDRDLPQSLSGVGVQQDPEPLALPVESADPLADLSHRLTGGNTEERPVVTPGARFNMSDEQPSEDSSDLQSHRTSSFQRRHNTRKPRKQAFLLLFMFSNQAAILAFNEDLFKTFEVMNWNVNVQITRRYRAEMFLGR